METKERDWIYLLPSGETAENMKEARKKISQQTGHNFSSESFRSLVRAGKVKKINRYNNSITAQSNAESNTKTA